VQPEQIEQQGITGTFHHCTIARLEEGSHDQVQALTRTRGGQDSTVVHLDIQFVQALEDLLAQEGQAQRRAVVEQPGHVGTTDLADCVTQVVRLAPAFGQSTATQFQLAQ
jgi:hypothetical protein